jgi:hypothetical protein
MRLSTQFRHLSFASFHFIVTSSRWLSSHLLQLDSMAFFHDLSFGADADVSGSTSRFRFSLFLKGCVRDWDVVTWQLSVIGNDACDQAFVGYDARTCTCVSELSMLSTSYRAVVALIAAADLIASNAQSRNLVNPIMFALFHGVCIFS